jgi:hypothetical protein
MLGAHETPTLQAAVTLGWCVALSWAFGL